VDYRRRVAIDVYYVRNRNVLLDIYILLKTTRVVLGGKGAY
jgi:lipopolysaccharide/colanic/teichoic acid biosynthesis glycosyltransferase